MADSRERGPRERAYDEEIYPLMEKIIGIAEASGIPFVASFELDGIEGGLPLQCTTAKTPEGTCRRLLQARDALHSGWDTHLSK